MDARTNASAVSIRPEVVAEFDAHWPSGIAPARDGRIFLSFPRLDPTPAPINLGELIDGKVVPFPDELVNAIDPPIRSTASSTCTGSRLDRAGGCWHSTPARRRSTPAIPAPRSSM